VFEISADVSTKSLEFILINSLIEEDINRKYVANNLDFKKKITFTHNSSDVLLFFVKVGFVDEKIIVQQKTLSLILHCNHYNNDNNLIDSNNIYIDLLCNENVISSKILI
jgi:hypothetical protein